MSTNTPKLRPCRNGDTLARAELPFGAYWEIKVEDPDERAPDKIAHHVQLRLNVFLPKRNGNSIRKIFLDSTATVLGEVLHDYWGGDGKLHRYNRTYAEGPTVAVTLAELLEKAREAEIAIRAVAAKTESYLAARAAAYAAFPVADTGNDEDA